ncbi:lysylphosphatidylglycerol synthase transmembrane domain-containing protein [Nocardiopsis mangrovi]|uniref:Lysylphosphatidylglycerol synthase transmembrane domain-containing protein n=1 Tax=Nocardiopsis mangrovi TaxID=1179818 RepID=A0ABV9DTE1_9ACTN
MLSRLRTDRWVRLVVVLVVLGCAGYALHSRWSEAREALAALSPWLVAGSVAAALAGLGAQMLAWRAILADLGSPLPLPTAARVMFVGQLGKYLPGSVWAFVAQVELARDHEVARQRGITATVLAVAVTLTVNLAVAAATLPFTSEDAARRWWWALAVAPVLLAALHPRVLTPVIHAAVRLARRSRTVPDEELERVSGRGMAAAVGWSVAAWVPLSLSIWLLVAGVDDGARGPGALAASAGAYALAWTLGVLVVIAPAGLGIRELVLVVALAPLIDPGSALIVAALSRLVTTLGDILWAGAALLATRSAAASPPAR